MTHQLIFQRGEKGIFSFLNKKLVIPDRFTKSAKTMTEGEYIVTIVSSHDTFYTCVPVKRIEPDLEQIKSLATRQKIVKIKNKIHYPYCRNNER